MVYYKVMEKNSREFIHGMNFPFFLIYKVLCDIIYLYKYSYRKTIKNGGVLEIIFKTPKGDKNENIYNNI